MSHTASFFPKAIVLFMMGAALVLSESNIAFSFQADEVQPVYERFSEYDETSTTRIDHGPLSDFLDKTVFNVGRSKSRLGRTKAEKYKESHITFGNTSPSRYEGNRVMFHAFSEDHKGFIKGYITGLERLSDRRPITSLNRDQQLAYWLNLHNLMVLDLLADEYPIKNLKGLRIGSSRQQPQWDNKTVLVEGVPLSIRDIELIVTRNWNSPMVLYGLYQGSIGGPSLPNYAFEGADVWDVLERYAREFVNSNRGVRPKGAKADVSIFYEWNMAAFSNSQDALIRHIETYTDTDFHGDISGLQELDFDYYDWIIADFLGGVKHTGRHNQTGGLQSGPGQTGSAFRYLQNWLPSGAGANILPPQALDLVVEVLQNNDVPRRTPVVTVEECGPDECLVKDEEPAPEQ